MKVASCKNKGRLLQKLVRNQLLTKFPKLTERDVASTSMGAGGEDIKLSQAAFDVFPYAVECKNLARIAVYKFYEQACNHGNGEPLVVLKQNRSKPLVLVDLEHFINIVGDNHDRRSVRKAARSPKGSQ